MTQKHQPNVTRLDNDYAKEQTAQLIKAHRQAVFRRRRLGLITIVTAVIFAFVGFQLYNDYQQVKKLEAIKAETVADHDIVAANVKQLEAEVARLNDKDYVAKLARSRFFYSKDGETVYPLPDQNAAKADKEEAKVKKALDDTHSSTTAEKQ